ncbi:Mitochondrial phosphate carrier protein 1, mitochondrial [Linum perenne]
MVADENGMLSIAVPGVEENDLKAAATTAGIGYYGLCTIGGILSAGTTHLLITPLDVLKVNMQAIKVKVQAQHHFAKGLLDGFPRLYASSGIHGYGVLSTSLVFWFQESQ